MKKYVVSESIQKELFNNEWKEGLVSGNGRLGVIYAGNPNEEIYIFQNMDFIMPTPQPRCIPDEVGAQLHEARQSVINKDESWDVDGRKRTYLYPFHPGERLRLKFPNRKEKSVWRVTDYENNEIKMCYEDDKGYWERKTFSSYEDDVIVSCMSASDKGEKVCVTLSVDDISDFPKYGNWKHGEGPETGVKYFKFADVKRGIIGLLAHYPVFEGSELAESGYLVISKVGMQGGKIEQTVTEEKNPMFHIQDADEICILTTTVKISDMGTLEEFGIEVGEKWILYYEQQLQQIVDKYTYEKVFFYDKARAASRKRKQQLFGEVSFSLSEATNGCEQCSNEEILQRQKENPMLLPELVERVYANGRYVLECCAGYAVPRLCGLWTGEFNPGWSGAYTMDANVNIQVSGMNVGNLYGAGLGYIYFVLRQIEDWKENARAVYGMEDALLVPVNTDGSRAVMVEYDKAYPFQYWNAGAAWMLLPIYEFWQCYGNKEISLPVDLRASYAGENLNLEQDILRPLLWKAMNFWMQLCTPEYFVDKEGVARYCKGKTALEEGEVYLIIPSYSPENHPLGYGSAITANAAMDIAAARDCMNMVIALEQHIQGNSSEDIIVKCRDLLKKLPEYLFDGTGALREWALREYQENNEHRHISHLYCAWPAYETEKDKDLRQACIQAVQNRDKANKGKDDTSSHGWIHRALVAARLKDGQTCGEILRLILSSEIFYSSLLTDHDTDKHRGVYCTDTSIGLVGVIQEMLLYSDDDCIEFLPAIAPEWTKGRICGLRTRNGVLVKEMEWDLLERKLHLVLEPMQEKMVSVLWRGMEGSFVTETGERVANGSSIRLQAGKISLKFEEKKPEL